MWVGPELSHHWSYVTRTSTKAAPAEVVELELDPLNLGVRRSHALRSAIPGQHLP